MNAIRVNFHANDTVSIFVDDQHLSRLTPSEVRQMMCQILMFGGMQMRDEIAGWLNGSMAQAAEVIAPEVRP